MTAAITNDLRARLDDRLRHAMQYAEEARRAAEEALEQLEAAQPITEDDHEEADDAQR